MDMSADKLLLRCRPPKVYTHMFWAMQHVIGQRCLFTSFEESYYDRSEPAENLLRGRYGMVTCNPDLTRFITPAVASQSRLIVANPGGVG
jgi:hypothetical protein